MLDNEKIVDALWTAKLRDRDREDVLVAGGRYYVLGTPARRVAAPRTLTFRRLATGGLVTSTVVTPGLAIPERFRELFPDTAELIEESVS